jgi:thymidine kinase
MTNVNGVCIYPRKEELMECLSGITPSTLRHTVYTARTQDLSSVINECESHDVICIDEAQFYPDLEAFCKHFISSNKRIIVSGLMSNFRGNVWPGQQLPAHGRVL